MSLTYEFHCVCVCVCVRERERETEREKERNKVWIERSPSVYNPPAVYLVKAECFVAVFIFQGGSNERFPELERGSYSGWRVEVSDFLKRGYFLIFFSQSSLHWN